MSRRVSHLVSMALSVGVVCVLLLRTVSSAPEPRRLVFAETPAEVHSAAPKLDNTKPAPMSVVALPPPPAKIAAAKAQNLGSRKKAVPVPPLKPIPVATVTAHHPPERTYLKPAPKQDQPTNTKPEDIEEDIDRATTKPDAKAVTAGRTLLRLLEHGSGPSVEIAWPAATGQRKRLYRRFRRCFGMRVAVLTEDERLFAGNGKTGVPWHLNLDAFSGFMRQHDGGASPREVAAIRRIRGLHKLQARGAPVRIFPRRVDAVLLGGLRQAIGANYDGQKTIRAQYALRRGGVFVENIQVDGRKVLGRIDLSAASSRPCLGRVRT